MALAIAEAVSSVQRAHADGAVAIHAVTQTPMTECPTSTWTAVAGSACGGVILDPSGFITIAGHGVDEATVLPRTKTTSRGAHQTVAGRRES
jgi:hypothetical protein